jgi:hypothetical protein
LLLISYPAVSEKLPSGGLTGKLEVFMELEKQITRVEGVQHHPSEHIGRVGDSQNNRAMLASINTYKQTIEKALGEKR